MIEESIRTMVLGLHPGESRGGLLCPACQGGRSNDKAFSVTLSDDGTVLYKCHRASCGFSGALRTGIRATEDAGDAGHAARPERPKAPVPTRSLSQLEVDRIYELYKIVPKTLASAGIRAYSGPEIGDRVVIPIEGPAGPDLRGYLRGYDYRELPPYTRRDKSRHYRISDPWAGWFGNGNEGTIVVEDSWSALKVAQELPGWRGCAIMGTHLSVEHVLEVNTVNRNWYLCLDADATLKAIKYKQRYQHLGNFSVCPVPRDLKYLDADEIIEVIR